MARKLKTCFSIFIYLIIIFPGFAFSDQGKIEKENEYPKTQIKEILKNQLETVFPCGQSKFSLNIIRPKPGIDNEIFKNTFARNKDYELRIIDPYTKKEITGLKVFPDDFLKNKLWTDELFSMRGVRPDPEIDKEIVMNNIDPNIQYEMNIVNPYLKNKRFGYYGPGLKGRQR